MSSCTLACSTVLMFYLGAIGSSSGSSSMTESAKVMMAHCMAAGMLAITVV